MSPKVRVGLLVGALSLTVGAVRWSDSLTDVPEASAGAVVDSTPRTRSTEAPARSAAPATPALDLKKLQRHRAASPDADPFGARSFRPAPPKPTAPTPAALAAAAAAPPPPPTPPPAPPLPFVYMGHLSEGADTTVFLISGERNLVVKPGDVIDNTYKLEEVNDRALVLTYLPLSQRQTLPIGAQ